MHVLFKINGYDWSCLLFPKIKSTVDVLVFRPQQVPCTELSWRIPLQFSPLPLAAALGAPHIPREGTRGIKLWVLLNKVLLLEQMLN